MRKVEAVKKFQWVLHLRCRKCGRKQTFEIAHEKDIPAHWFNGWFLEDTELCPMCDYPPFAE